ncbi:trifolitoxin immunity protein [Desertihabitans brevis]|uniref:Trifolitoxin immunity protein n=1 Tax=Desertihabitans brevis TaxID=2268447 RepID=A0A367YTM4_9ACTN|nr:phosphotransferase [Desertihabitans brevis]RCK69245.1 trifolitoxin immunity protein [Desertihabitans brevis]
MPDAAPGSRRPVAEPAGTPLPGGFVSSVVRVGAEVHRRPGPRADFVHRLLRHYEACGWSGAPRLLGSTAEGRERLSHLDGVTSVDRPELAVPDDAALLALCRLVRRCHDLTAGTELAGDAETVCHHDLDPRNTVHRRVDGRWLPVALVDWDLAAPGRRVQDVARIGWQYLGPGPAADAGEVGRRLRLVADGYGLGDVDRAELVPTMLWWQERCWRGIETAADDGDAAMVALRDRGVPAQVRAVAAWTADAAEELRRWL